MGAGGMQGTAGTACTWQLPGDGSSSEPQMLTRQRLTELLSWSCMTLSTCAPDGAALPDCWRMTAARQGAADGAWGSAMRGHGWSVLPKFVSPAPPNIGVRAFSMPCLWGTHPPAHARVLECLSRACPRAGHWHPQPWGGLWAQPQSQPQGRPQARPCCAPQHLHATVHSANGRLDATCQAWPMCATGLNCSNLSACTNLCCSGGLSLCAW